MSYVVSDPDYSPYIASFLHDPARRVGPMTISLITAAVTGILGSAFILHQIGQLPTVDPNETRPIVDLAAFVVEKPAKLEVLPHDINAPVVNAAYVYTSTNNAQKLSAEWTSDDSAELIAALEASRDIVPSPVTIADQAGPGQVIDTPVAQSAAPAAEQLATAEPAYDQARPAYLVAVPDEELAAMAQ